MPGRPARWPVQTPSLTRRRCPFGPVSAIAEALHLRHLMALVLLRDHERGALDYLFKAKAVETFGPGDGLLRFFALYYAVTSLIAFLLQTLGSRPVLERFGLVLTTSTPSIALPRGH